jgi:hypothetical protein
MVPMTGTANLEAKRPETLGSMAGTRDQTWRPFQSG